MGQYEHMLLALTLNNEKRVTLYECKLPASVRDSLRKLALKNFAQCLSVSNKRNSAARFWVRQRRAWLNKCALSA